MRDFYSKSHGGGLESILALESFSDRCVKHGIGVNKELGRLVRKLLQGSRLGATVVWASVVAVQMETHGSVVDVLWRSGQLD